MNMLTKTTVVIFITLAIATISTFAQTPNTTPFDSQELSDKEGIPVIIKHLPDWETKQNEAVFITSSEDLKEALGERTILEQIEFVGGAEAVTANYAEGKLLIVEYGGPQASSETDTAIKENLGENSGVVYKRIGNYNVFVFDGNDEAASLALMDKIKYQKVVRWLGRDPYIRQRAERNFIETTSSLFIATVLAIVSGLGLAVFLGIIAGIIFFNIRKKNRALMPTFSDGGGLTRLNLDDLTPPIGPDGKLLND